jgi:outer membrane protein assembly factor BamB
VVSQRRARTGVRLAHPGGPGRTASGGGVQLLASARRLGRHGEKLWSIPSSQGGYTTPARYKDLLICATSNGEGPLCAIRLEKEDKGIVVKEVWKEKGLPMYYNSPVVAGDLLFAMSNRKRGCFYCLDARSGKLLWQSSGKDLMGNASILSAGDVVLFQTDRGRLVIVKSTGKGYEPIAGYTVSDTRTDAHPVFLGERILVRDRTTLRSLRIGKK